MSNETRRPITHTEEREVRFWVEALLKGPKPARAAEEIYSIGVRTRGSVRAPAASRFPADTPVREILDLLKREEPGLRLAVAAALAEWGGGDAALEALALIAVGEGRDGDRAVRAAALDAIGMIGGPRAAEILAEALRTEPDRTVKSLARSALEAGQHA